MQSVCRNASHLYSFAGKDQPLEPRLTLLLPVRNAQASLSRDVARILEIAADLSPCFELLILDRGSTDATEEVADELARSYPQVRTARCLLPSNSNHLDPPNAADDASKVVFEIDSADANASLAAIARHWRRSNVELCSSVVGIEQFGRTDRSPSFSRAGGPPAKRPAYNVDRAESSGPSRPNFLTRLKNFALGE